MVIAQPKKNCDLSQCKKTLIIGDLTSKNTFEWPCMKSCIQVTSITFF